MGVETANIHIEQFGYIAHYFAEWGRTHFEDKSEMVCEDLEEYYKKEMVFLKMFSTGTESDATLLDNMVSMICWLLENNYIKKVKTN
jgi:hypothetical protein